jgi:hypothetical protein
MMKIGRIESASPPGAAPDLSPASDLKPVYVVAWLRGYDPRTPQALDGIW